MSQTVMLGMSGGVDSSAAALILKNQGYDVHGVTFNMWGPVHDGDIQDAKRVCDSIGISHEVVDFRKLFDEKVVSEFVRSYERGETPNPCINCNRFIKFGAAYAHMQEKGYDFLATGHYARVLFNDETGEYELRRGLYSEKDQSYVLYQCTQEILSHTLFPLGSFSKEEIRSIAAKAGLLTAKKKDSQDICFIPDGDYGLFLQQRSGKMAKKGNFVDEEGHILGEHQGIIHYTIGQRKGLGISLGAHAFVESIDASSNEVRLTLNESRIFEKDIEVRDVNWISGKAPVPDTLISAKIRYRHPVADATVESIPNDSRWIAHFQNPQRAPAPGQSIVFYDHDRVLGGGIICKKEK